MSYPTRRMMIMVWLCIVTATVVVNKVSANHVDAIASSTTALPFRLRHEVSTDTIHPQLQPRQDQPLKEEVEIQRAIDLLESVGVVGWCHDESIVTTYDSVDTILERYNIPPCSSSTILWDSRHLAAVTEEFVEKDDWFYIKNGILAALCVVTAALAAGLTMGLLSIDPLLLHIKIRASSSDTEKQFASRLLPIVKQHHRLLVSLLLLNSIANEALPLFLDSLVGSYFAVILSVTLVLFFGEIIPSALFTGPNQLELAARLAPLVRLVMMVLCPIAYPIAKLLDIVLHDEDEDGGYNRGELSALVRIQYEEHLATKQRRKLQRSEAALQQQSHDELGEQQENDGTKVRFDLPDKRLSSIHADEVNMVEGALSMKTKTAMDVYTPLHRVFAIPETMILTERNLVKIYSSGHSRIPIYEKNPNKPKDISRIKGVLISKQLIVVNTHDSRCVSTLPLYQPYCVSPHENLVDLINKFQTGGFSKLRGGHMALVCARPQVATEALESGGCIPQQAGLLGIITLEDVLEELLQEEIYDETDRLQQQQEELAKWAFSKWKQFVWGKNNKTSNAFADVVGATTLQEDTTATVEAMPLVRETTNEDDYGSSLLLI